MLKTVENSKMLRQLSSRLELIFHPICVRVLIEADQREVTTKQIRDAMPDVSSASLYRYLRRMVAEGVLAVVSERPVRGTVEKTYAATKIAHSPNAEAGPPDPEAFLGYFLGFLGLLQKQFRLYIKQGVFAPEQDGLLFGACAPYLTPEERNQVTEEIEAVLKKAMTNKMRSDRQPYLIFSSVIPNKQEI